MKSTKYGLYWIGIALSLGGCGVSDITYEEANNKPAVQYLSTELTSQKSINEMHGLEPSKSKPSTLVTERTNRACVSGCWSSNRTCQSKCMGDLYCLDRCDDALEDCLEGCLY